jgi:uncharacterized protein (DUF3084 family)
MSDKAKSTLGSLSYYAAVATVAVLLFTKAVGAGEILGEIKALRGDLNAVKTDISNVRAQIDRNRLEREAAFKEILGEYRKLEHRVELLEMLDTRKLNTYERAK